MSGGASPGSSVAPAGGGGMVALARVARVARGAQAQRGEGIYGTRPWKMFGEGPATEQKGEGKFNENGRKALTPQDIRYTTKGKALYAFIMGWPGAQAVVPAVTDSAVHARNVELLGHKGKLK